jgi:hypothetical protein
VLNQCNPLAGTSRPAIALSPNVLYALAVGEASAASDALGELSSCLQELAGLLAAAREANAASRPVDPVALQAGGQWRCCAASSACCLC